MGQRPRVVTTLTTRRMVLSRVVLSDVVDGVIPNAYVLPPVAGRARRARRCHPAGAIAARPGRVARGTSWS